jgi:uncharacterized membrane protein
MPQLSFAPVGHWLLVALAAGALVALLAIRPETGRTSRGRQWALLGLRLGAVVLVIFTLLRPTLVYRTTLRRTATLVVLVDQSRSLLVAEEGQASRWQRLVQTLQAAAPDLKELSRDLEIRCYQFDDAVRPLPFNQGVITLPAEPAGDQTALGAALSDLLRLEAGKRLVGVVVLTDGNQKAFAPRDREPHLAARQYQDLGCPIHTVVFGKADSQSQPRDIALEKLIVNSTVYVKNQLTVSAAARLSGFVNQSVAAQLWFETSPGKMELVKTMPIKAPADGDLVPIEMTYAPQLPGEYRLTLKVVPQPGELVTANNERSTFVAVIKGGLNVLYLEGALRVEQRYLRKALDASEDIHVDYLRLDAQRPQQRPGDVAKLLADGLKRGKYDVYILGDLDAAAFLPGELETLKQTVDQGAGLLMLGGFHSFGPGGYATTPLADVLPIRMTANERQQFNEPLRTDVHLLGSQRLRPTTLAGRQFVTQLTAADRNARLWESLPPLDGANKFRDLKDATVLLETPAGAPILVAGNSASGRVLAFAGDSTWRWWTHGFADAHKRFWRQVVLWLAFKDQAEEGRVWVKLEERRIPLGAPITFTAGARSAHGEPVPDAEFSAQILLPGGGRQPLRLTRQGDQFSGTFRETSAEGEYRIIAEASARGQPLGTTSARLVVFKQDVELELPVADPLAMQRLSALTPGGESIPPEEFPTLVQKLRRVPRELEQEVLTKATLWDKWPLYALLALFLCGEWFFRKKWGLV